MRQIFLALFLSLIFAQAYGQKVGLVFSGGAAKGLAHIGVLKALEENNIPIDYIVGTSMGGIVGGMYAAGYSPSEIEYIALSKDFQDWVSGRYNSDYRYYFRKKPDNPSIISAKLQIDTGFQARIRSNLVNDIPLNFALLEMLAQPSANARNDFNNLFVPFRTIVSDVLSQKMIPVKSGSLVEAIRGTMTVPLVYRPIKVDGKYVFDGGLYNNFPVDVMKKDFGPDVIIGANVSSKVFNEYPKDSDEKLMSRFLIYMFLSKSDSTVLGNNDVYIQPDVSEYSVTNFTPVAELIKKGYDAAMADMPRIKELIKRRVSTQELKEKRGSFEKRNPDLAFRNIYVEGGNSKQRRYVERVFRQDKEEISLMDIKEGYYKLAADDNFETIYPNMKYQQSNDAYDFILQVQQQRNFKIDFGGVISTRPISNAYLGLQYNFVRGKSYTANANFYSGRFYESVQAMFRIDYPTSLPFYIEPEFTYNHWNYTNTSEIFVEDIRPVFVEQSDRRMVLNTGIPLARNGKLSAHVGFLNFDDKYSPTNQLQVGDQLDRTVFNGFMTGISLEKNTLNRKLYPTKGISFSLSGTYYTGTEEYTPGNIFRNEPFYPSIRAEEHDRNWLRARISTEQYVYSRKTYSLGYLLEAVASTRPLFVTYKSNLLSAPAFNPLQDSKTLYLEHFRANNYGAFGIKNILGIYKNIDLRLEAYIFQPLRTFKPSGNQDTGLGDIFGARYYAATAGMVYHSPVGPVSLSFNHYDDDQKRYGIMFHIGYLIYNKRSFE